MYDGVLKELKVIPILNAVASADDLAGILVVG